MRVYYSPEAISDLTRLREFISDKNPQAAQQAAAAIVKGISQRTAFPYLGVEVERAPEPRSVRDIIIGKYIARYLVSDEEVYVLRIWHHKEARK